MAARRGTESVWDSASESDGQRRYSRGQRARWFRTTGGYGYDASVVHDRRHGGRVGRLQLPLLGSFYATDMIVVLWVMSFNVLRTLSLAEILDTFWQALGYHGT